MTCGTNSSYNHGCHCELCTAAHAERQRVYNQRHYEKHRDKILAIQAKYKSAGRTRARTGEPKPAKKRDWMDLRAEEVWAKLKSDEPRPFKMFRSPLYDI